MELQWPVEQLKCVSGVPEGEGRENYIEEIFERIMAPNLPTPITHSQIQWKIPTHRSKKLSESHAEKIQKKEKNHIIIILLKIKDKEKSYKKLEEKRPPFPCIVKMAFHSSTLAWKIPWREEPDRLQSTGSQRVGHDWATSLSMYTGRQLTAP